MGDKNRTAIRNGQVSTGLAVKDLNDGSELSAIANVGGAFNSFAKGELRLKYKLNFII